MTVIELTVKFAVGRLALLKLSFAILFGSTSGGNYTLHFKGQTDDRGYFSV